MVFGDSLGKSKSMNKRELLTKTVAGLFCLLLIAFAWVFFNGLALNFESSSGSSNTPLENALFLFG